MNKKEDTMRRLLSIALVVFVSISMIFASGSGEADNQKVIRICQFKVEIADDLQRLAEEYEELTGIKIEVESTSSSDYQTLLRTKFAGNEAPDIFNNEGFSQMTEWAEHLEDLSDEVWVADMVPQAIEGASINGRIYGLPLYFEGYGWCYNPKIFEKAGITELPKTLDEFDDICERLEAEGFAPIGLPFGASYNPGRFMFNVAVAHQENPTEFIEAACRGEIDFVNNEIMNEWVDMLDICIKHAYKNPLDMDYSGQLSAFAFEEVAMTMANNGAWVSFTEMNPDIDADYMVIPIDNDPSFNDVLYAGPSTYWVVNKNSPVKEEAKDFLEWLVTSERGQYYLTEVFGFVPGLSTMSVSEEQVGPLSAAVSEAIVNGKTLGWEWPKYPNGAADDIGDAIIEYAAGRLDRVQFLERVQDIFVRLS